MFISQNQEKNARKDLIEKISGRTGPLECTGVYGAHQAWLLSRLCISLKKPLTLVLPSWKQAEVCMEDLRFFLQKARIPVHAFPPCTLFPFRFIPYPGKTAAERLRLLYRLAVGEIPPLIVTTQERDAAETHSPECTECLCRAVAVMRRVIGII
ncbi:MAG: hypothetical protein R2941_08390 [Desulfobacterales bacterium]